MDNKEAINIIERQLGKEYLKDYEDIQQAKDMAISALEKQIPEKQGNLYKLEEHLNIDIDGFVVCRITHKDIKYPLIGLKDFDYCPRCGQKLDWSDL